MSVGSGVCECIWMFVIFTFHPKGRFHYPCLVPDGCVSAAGCPLSPALCVGLPGAQNQGDLLSPPPPIGETSAHFQQVYGTQH